MRIGRVVEVMFFVAEPEVSARWWAEAFGLEMRMERGLLTVELDGASLSFHPMDLVLQPYGSSTVPYLEVDDFDAVRARMVERGSEEWRGPWSHSDGKRYLQLRDPRGLVLGIVGT
jgi:predicted enzyme related to lactoylglutathione lyase